eukprot:2752012-Rhodomonas_salina.1
MLVPLPKSGELSRICGWGKSSHPLAAGSVTTTAASIQQTLGGKQLNHTLDGGTKTTEKNRGPLLSLTAELLRMILGLRGRGGSEVLGV